MPFKVNLKAIALYYWCFKFMLLSLKTQNKNNMKFLKTILIIFIALFSFQPSAKAQVYEKGDFVLNAFYGSPSIATLYSKSFLDAYDINDFYYLGPVGAHPEFLLTKRIGVGAEISYSSTIFDFYDYSFYYKYSISRIRVMPRFSIHLGSSTKFENHFSLAVGYRSTMVNITSDNTDLAEVQAYEDDLKDVLGLYSFPIGLRITWGCKYFVTENLGLSFDIGLGGGSTFTGGLAFKMNTKK